MDELDAIYATECERDQVDDDKWKDLSNKRKQNDSSEPVGMSMVGEDIPDSRRRTDLSETMLSDIESQILPTGCEVPESINSELRIKHVDQDSDKGDILGGYIVTTKEVEVYHHVFTGLSQTGILYKDMQIRDGDALLRINDKDTYSLTHEELVGKFERLETKEKQSMVTSNIENGEIVQISFILVGYKPENERARNVKRTMAAMKAILKIRCKENYCYLSAETQQQPPSLLFERINAGNRHRSWTRPDSFGYFYLVCDPQFKECNMATEYESYFVRKCSKRHNLKTYMSIYLLDEKQLLF